MTSHPSHPLPAGSWDQWSQQAPPPTSYPSHPPSSLWPPPPSQPYPPPSQSYYPPLSYQPSPTLSTPSCLFPLPPLSSQPQFRSQDGTTATFATPSGGIHTIDASEVRAYADYMREKLGSGDASGLTERHRVDPQRPDSLFDCLKDGFLLCKLLHAIKPDAVEISKSYPSPKNKFECLINHKMFLSALTQLGVKLVNISPEDLMNDDKQYLAMAVLWQLIRLDLSSRINIVAHPEIAALLEEGESPDSFANLPPEATVLRWVNFHLKAAQSQPRQISNFGPDLADSHAYAALLGQLEPGRCPALPVTQLHGPLDRAQAIISYAQAIGALKFIGSSQDIVSGNPNLNFAFTAALFDKYPLSMQTISNSEAESLRAAVERAWREKLEHDEADFRSRMQAELQAFEREKEEMRRKMQAEWEEEAAAKRRFLEQEAKQLHDAQQALFREREQLSAAQQSFQQSNNQPYPFQHQPSYYQPSSSYQPPALMFPESPGWSTPAADFLPSSSFAYSYPPLPLPPLAVAAAAADPTPATQHFSVDFQPAFAPAPSPLYPLPQNPAPAFHPEQYQSGGNCYLQPELAQYDIPEHLRMQHLQQFATQGQPMHWSYVERVQLVLIVDHSGSMYAKDQCPTMRGRTPPSWTRWKNCIQCAGYIAESLFARSSHPHIPLYLFSSLVQHTMVSNRNQLVDKLHRLTPSGTTNLLGALQLAFSTELPKYRPDHGILFIVMTDGEPNPGQERAIQTLIAQKLPPLDPSGDRLNVLFIRFGDDPTAVRFLRSLDDCAQIGAWVDTKSDDAVYAMGPDNLIANAIYEHMDQHYQHII